MIGWLVWLGALGITVAVLTWGLNRELQRLERERRMREWLATSPAAFKLKVDYEAMARQIGERLLPAMQALAQGVLAMQPKFAALTAAIEAALKEPPAEPVTEPQGERGGDA